MTTEHLEQRLNTIRSDVDALESRLSSAADELARRLRDLDSDTGTKLRQLDYRLDDLERRTHG